MSLNTKVSYNLRKLLHCVFLVIGEPNLYQYVWKFGEREEERGVDKRRRERRKGMVTSSLCLVVLIKSRREKGVDILPFVWL